MATPDEISQYKSIPKCKKTHVDTRTVYNVQISFKCNTPNLEFSLLVLYNSHDWSYACNTPGEDPNCSPEKKPCSNQ